MTIEDSLAYDNGTLSSGRTAGNGDRNGFKLGGEDTDVDHIIRRNVAWRGNVSCHFAGGGSTDRTEGSEADPNWFHSGSNAPACEASRGTLSWFFSSSGRLELRFS